MDKRPLTIHSVLPDQRESSMSVVIGGGSGFIGRHLVRALSRKYERIHVLTRGPQRSASDLTWDAIRAHGLPADCEAVVGLQGAMLWEPFRRLDERGKREIRDSRIETMKMLVRAADSAPKVRTMVSLTGVACYPPSKENRYTERTDEASIESKDDFLHSLVVDWERASAPRSPGIRHVILRPGIVLGRDGGFIESAYTPYWLGLGFTFSGGEHWFPWIHVDDMAGLIEAALASPKASGPYNAVAPSDPITQRQFAQSFAASFKPRRPVWLSLPRCVLNQMFSPELTSAIICNGQHVRSVRISEDMPEFVFKYPTIQEACASFH